MDEEFGCILYIASDFVKILFSSYFNTIIGKRGKNNLIGKRFSVSGHVKKSAWVDLGVIKCKNCRNPDLNTSSQGWKVELP